MYNVLLVEDEAAICERFRNWEFWQEGIFHLCGEARNGEMALQMLEECKPDIILSDIKMPFMDGLEFSRIVKIKYPSIRIIIVSGHDDFDYAHRAIKIGVDEYILKPVTPMKMMRTLNDVAESIASQNAESGLPAVPAFDEAHDRSVRMWFAYELSHGLLATDMAITKAKDYQIELLGQLFRVARVTTDNHVKSMYEEIDGLGVLCYQSNDTTWVIIFIASNADALEEKIDSFKAFSGRLGILMTELGSIQNRINDIPKSYEFIKMGGHLTSTAASTADDFCLFNRDEMYKLLKTGSIEDARNYIRSLFANHDEAILRSRSFRNYVRTSIVSDAIRIVRKMNGDPVEIIPELTRIDNLSGEDESVEAFAAHIEDIAGRAIQFRNDVVRSDAIIVKACGFIDDNITKYDLSQREVARHINLSQNYFSTLFKKEVGVGFTKYVNQKRIELAKELLKMTGKHIFLIAQEVGYDDPAYFNTIFKQMVGVTPKRYRSEG